MKIVDSNEPWEIRSKLLELGWEVKPLPAGDFSFPDHNNRLIGIERKAVSDLLGSISGRLGNQLERMLDCYNESILLLEGGWRTIANKVVTEQGISRWEMSAIWNCLRSWQRKGITLELTASTNHTIRRVNELYAYYQKPFHSGGANGHTFIDDRVLAFPAGCRGKTALKILERYSLAKIGNLGLLDLQKIDSVGEKKAQAIYSHFNRRS